MANDTIQDGQTTSFNYVGGNIKLEIKRCPALANEGINASRMY